MSLYLGVTDYDWFRLLAAIPGIEEVNFWRPSAQRAFASLGIGEPFLFKLHSPRNFIVGGGFFARFVRLPVSLAWESFGLSNGASSFAEVKARIGKYRRTADLGNDPEIGCVLLAEPFFFAETDWIPCPPEFPLNAVQGKTYGPEDPVGQRLWEQVQLRLQAVRAMASAPSPALDHATSARFGAPTLVAPRLGQGIFRAIVTEEYERRCSVTGERTLPVLEAAHIRPYADGGVHDVANGLLLRSDLHKLLDRGYVSVDPLDRRFVVSGRIREDFENGRDYYALHGRQLRDPRDQRSIPSKENLSFHAERVFLG